MHPNISQGRTVARQVLEKGGRVVVRGPVGSGLRTLAASLASEHKETALIELLDLEEPDAAAAGLLQAIAAVPTASAREDLLKKLPRTKEAARAVADSLNEAGKSLVVLIPPAWARAGGDPADEDQRWARGRALLQGFATAHRLVMLSDLHMDLTGLGIPPSLEERLPSHLVRLDPDVPDWGGYANAARRLRNSVPLEHVTSPLIWRLAVGALELGAALVEILSWCLRPTSEALSGLTSILATRIKSTPGLVGSVRKALRVRRPLPPNVLAAVTGIPSNHVPLLTACLGYGDPVRISPTLRGRLLEAMSAREAPLEDAHVALAKHYKTLDGVDSPALVKDVLQMEAWVERVHHLASAGEQGAAEWQTLKLPSPEFYWDRARALSIRFKRYEDAARIYLSCVKHFPEDDYAHHYAAWNFEKARIEPVESRQHYACAVELAQDNPWWNARYAGFLIRSGERQEARNAWRKALQAVDPDGTDTARRPWLADHLHYWVAKSWYEAGHWREARRVLEGVPQDIRKRSVRHFNELETALDESERNERARLIEWLALQQGLAWDAVQAFWENLSQRIHDLPLPVASQGDDHRALLAWSLPDLYLEIEMDEGGTLAWYARDHRLKVSDVGESPSLDITPELLRWLERVAHA